MSSATQRELLASLELVAAGDDTFVGSIPSAERDSPWNLYGGHLLGQSLAALCRTVDPAQLPHSFHGYFLRAADATAELTYQATRTRDGRSFSHRHLTASQADLPVFEMIASFQHPQSGRLYQQEMPSGVPDPDDLLGLPELVATLEEEPFDS
ncbi:MAG: thioesterase family protein, partial [Actinomycetota bacterium]|nr:thioesterase family protein [Actinomycetota bacterium]